MNRKMMALFAEFLGTFALTTAFLFTGNWLIIAITLGVIGWTIGSISGANVNPALTFAMWLKGTFPVQKVLSYYAVQFLGAAAAYYTYAALT